MAITTNLNLSYLDKTGRVSGSNSSDNNDGAELVQGIVTNLFDLLKLFGANESGTADADVRTGTNDAGTLQAAAKNTAETTNASAQVLIANLENLQLEIQEKIDSIKDDEDKKKDFQDDLNDSKRIILDNKEILNKPDSTPSERVEALRTVRGESEKMQVLSGQVETVAKGIQTKSEAVQGLSDTSGELKDNIDLTITQGQQQLNQNLQQAQTQAANASKMEVKGGVNEGTSVAAKTEAQTLRATAKASSFVPVAGGGLSAAEEATAQKLDQVSVDQGGAGKSRIAGAAQILQQLTTSIGSINSDLAGFANFTNSALGLATGNTDLASNFNNMFGQIGSWFEQGTELEDQGKTIAQAADEAGEKLGINTDDKNADNVDGDNSNSDKTSDEQIFNPDLKVLDNLTA